MKSTALPQWMYRDPQEIADGLIAYSAKIEKVEKRKAELHRIHKGRRIRALVRLAKKNGGSAV